MCLFSNFIPEYCGWNVSSHLQSGWRGRPSLPTGLTSSWDQRGTHQSERFRLRLAPSEAQCPGQTGTNTRCLAAAGPEPPWSHTHTPQPTCWSEFFHFSETRRFPWMIQHSIFIVMDCQPVQVYFTPPPTLTWVSRKLSGCHLLTCRHFWWGGRPVCRGRWSLFAWTTTLHFLSKTSRSGRTNSVCIRKVPACVYFIADFRRFLLHGHNLFPLPVKTGNSLSFVRTCSSSWTCHGDWSDWNF